MCVVEDDVGSMAIMLLTVMRLALNKLTSRDLRARVETLRLLRYNMKRKLGKPQSTVPRTGLIEIELAGNPSDPCCNTRRIPQASQSHYR